MEIEWREETPQVKPTPIVLRATIDGFEVKVEPVFRGIGASGWLNGIRIYAYVPVETSDLDELKTAAVEMVEQLKAGGATGTKGGE